uniref:histidine kinase n=1 Tax=Desulfovibrio sp. U5L TaxID=596152 RepID=I2Q297_9BACT
MNVFGLWLEDAAARFAPALTAGYALERIGSEADLPAARDGLVVDAAVLLRHAAAVAARKAESGQRLYPVVALLPADADEAAVDRALAVADETARLPIVPAALARRLDLLLALGRSSENARDLDACRLRTDAALRTATADLSSRVKALTCLSEVHGVIQRFNQPREDLFRAVAALLPPAFARPDLIHARVVADGGEFASPGFRPGPWRLVFSLAASGQPDAVLEVHHDGAGGGTGAEAFSAGERELARLVAERLERTMARLRDDAALGREREFSARLMDTLPGGVVRLDRNGTIAFCNPRAADILEREARTGDAAAFAGPQFEAMALDGRRLAPDEHPVALVLATGRPVYDTALSIARPGGGRRFLSVSAAPLVGPDGAIEEVVASVTDITRQKDMERQLAHALKMESLGQLASGIAHEINTPIQYVGGNLEFLATTFGRLVELLDRLGAAALRPESKECLAADLAGLIGDEELRFLLEETPDALRESREGLDRVASIVLSMKRFAHPDQEAPRPVDVGEAICDTLAVSRSAWKYVADVETDIEPDLPAVSFVPGDLNQVLLNILVNAAQAIEEKAAGQGGKGTIRIAAVRRGNAVEVTVRDTGPGIPEALRSRIFDPFFTTKEVGKGTGQGLAIVHALMARHHAGLDFLSTPGEGTTFVLTLPLAGPEQLTA